jgi:hypothetical protein
MSAISELEIIRQNPIKEGLRTFRRRFESTQADLGITTTSSNYVQAVFLSATVAGMARLLYR